MLKFCNICVIFGGQTDPGIEAPSRSIKHQVPSDIPTHGQYMNPENLNSQEYLNKINDWSERHKIVISEKKTEAMIFNFTTNLQQDSK